jgi:hypothetical protein
MAWLNAGKWQPLFYADVQKMLGNGKKNTRVLVTE